MKLLCLLFVFFCSVVSADERLAAAIEQVISENEPNAHIGIKVVSLKEGKVIYERNARHLFVPASNTKTFTTAAALYLLGSDFCFQTEVFLDEETGDLYLKGGGDPELSTRDLEELIGKMKCISLKELSGKLYLDHTDYDDVPMGPGWMWDEGAEFWNSPMDALVVNHSCVNVQIRAAEKEQQPPSIQLFPQTDYVSLSNQAVTAKELTDLHVTRKWMTKENRLVIQGNIAAGHEPMDFFIPIEFPCLYTGHLFRELLRAQGIQMSGSLEERKVPLHARRIASHDSRPLAQIVVQMMEHSDNLTADCIFKKIGQMQTGEQGTWQNANKAVRAFLKEQIGIDPTDLVLLDGCGLSRYNLVSPEQLYKLLLWADRTPRISSAFHAALPPPGRFQTKPWKDKIRAKCGSMTGISTLAGYLETDDGDRWIFSIMANGFTKPRSEYRERVENRICEILITPPVK